MTHRSHRAKSVSLDSSSEPKARRPGKDELLLTSISLVKDRSRPSEPAEFVREVASTFEALQGKLREKRLRARSQVSETSSPTDLRKVS